MVGVRRDGWPASEEAEDQLGEALAGPGHNAPDD
jgi:hypothetical protein